MSRLLTVMACSVAILATPSAARAVVPAPSRVLELAREGAPPATAWVMNLLEAPAEGPARKALRVASDGAGRLRMDAQALDTGLTTTTWYGPSADSTVLPLESAPLWVLYLAGQPLDGLLRVRGVAMDRTSLAHADEAVLWVLGAGPREDSLPQVAVERATGRVRRLVERAGASENPAVIDVFFDGQQPGEEPAARFPARVRMKSGAAAVVVWRLSWLGFGAAAGAPEMTPPAHAPDSGAP